MAPVYRLPWAGAEARSAGSGKADGEHRLHGGTAGNWMEPDVWSAFDNKRSWGSAGFEERKRRNQDSVEGYLTLPSACFILVVLDSRCVWLSCFSQTILAMLDCGGGWIAEWVDVWKFQASVAVGKRTKRKGMFARDEKGCLWRSGHWAGSWQRNLLRSRGGHCAGDK